jgi:hypothetical protein
VPIADRLYGGFFHNRGKRRIAHPLGQVHAPDGIALHRHGANFRLNDMRSDLAQVQMIFCGGRHESMSTTNTWTVKEGSVQIFNVDVPRIVQERKMNIAANSLVVTFLRCLGAAAGVTFAPRLGYHL